MRGVFGYALRGVIEASGARTGAGRPRIDTLSVDLTLAGLRRGSAAWFHVKHS